MLHDFLCCYISNSLHQPTLEAERFLYMFGLQLSILTLWQHSHLNLTSESWGSIPLLTAQGWFLSAGNKSI